MGTRVREYEGVEVGEFEGEAVGIKVGTNMEQKEGVTEGLLVIRAGEGNALGKAEGKVNGTEVG